MHSSEVEARISALIEQGDVEAVGADCDFTVTVISDAFDGLSSLKRQQMILAVFTEELASGALHALSVKTFTYAEWNNRQSGLVQISI